MASKADKRLRAAQRAAQRALQEWRPRSAMTRAALARRAGRMRDQEPRRDRERERGAWRREDMGGA